MTKRRMDSSSRKALPMETIALLADKTCVSDRAAATIASAVLVANASNEESECNVVIDRHKLRRARKKARTNF